MLTNSRGIISPKLHLRRRRRRDARGGGPCGGRGGPVAQSGPPPPLELPQLSSVLAPQAPLQLAPDR
eukprot:1615176-Pyramimonas_sp.AAC.1